MRRYRSSSKTAKEAFLLHCIGMQHIPSLSIRISSRRIIYRDVYPLIKTAIGIFISSWEEWRSFPFLSVVSRHIRYLLSWRGNCVSYVHTCRFYKKKKKKYETYPINIWSKMKEKLSSIMKNNLCAFSKLFDYSLLYQTWILVKYYTRNKKDKKYASSAAIIFVFLMQKILHTFKKQWFERTRKDVYNCNKWCILNS